MLTTGDTGDIYFYRKKVGIPLSNSSVMYVINLMSVTINKYLKYNTIIHGVGLHRGNYTMFTQLCASDFCIYFQYLKQG